MASSAETKTPSRLNFRIFATLEQAQSNHGIPHQDYAQYHQYCTNRLARLRRIEPVRAHLVHNHKYVEGVSGRRHAYCPRALLLPTTAEEETDNTEPTPVVQHENLLWNVFFQAERAWAHAMQQPRRLKKAAKWASQMVDVAKSLGCDEVTVQEAESYAAWMKGNAALEKKRYLEAFRAYRDARNILLQLADQTEESREELALKDTWLTRAESVLRPLVRYCHYEAREDLEPTDLLEDNETKNDIKSSELVLNFRGKEIDIEAYKDLAVLYLKMEDKLKDTSELDETSFLQLLSDLDDAIKWAQAEYSHYESLPAGPSVTAKREDLQTMSGYFQYQKLSTWRHQQEKLVADLSEDSEIVHIYDTLLQNANAMAELPQAEGKDVEEDPFYLEAQAHVVRIRAFRCYYLARLYESSLNGTPKQVLALLRHSKTLAQRAQEEVAACDNKEVDAYLNDLDDLLSKIAAMTCRAEAAVFLQSDAASSTQQTNRPLWLRLEDLDAGPVLADNPPLPIPIPCKPVFYDIAWQRIGGDFPIGAIEEYIARHEDKKKATKSSGLLGWFRSS